MMSQPEQSSNTVSSRLPILAALFVTVLITSNIIAVKLIDVAGLILPAAIVIFPISYILVGVLTEVYGFRVSRRVIWLGFGCNLLAVAGIWLGGLLPAAGFWQDQEAYDAILGMTPRILLASFAAYLVGEFTNAYILARIKVAMAGRRMWVRFVGSTLVGQALDSTVFITIAFAGIVPWPQLLMAVVTQWLVKSAYEALALPGTYAVVGYLKRKDGIDVYDRDTRFNPLSVRD